MNPSTITAATAQTSIAPTTPHQTTSLCTVCKQGVPAEVVERDGAVWMDKFCDTHGAQSVLIASDAAWYRDALSMPAALVPPREPQKAVQQGCPFDCGACTAHEQTVYLPVVPITSACDLDCPICYTINKNEGAFHMGADEFARVLETIRRHDPELKIINLTGGEPTRHPDLPGIVAQCHAAGIHRVTISTHGLAFIHDEALLEALAKLDARIVLSFNSFDADTNKRMLGANVLHAKLKVLEKLERYDIDTTLIPVLALGVNDHEIGDLIDFAFAKRFIRSLELHTMTFTGQGGTGFDATARITVPDVLRAIEARSGGRVRMSDFTPSPCAHPLCYQTAYLLETDAGLVPFARFMSRAQIRELLTGNLYMEPGATMERVLSDVIADLWSRDDDAPAESSDVLAALRALLKRMFPPGGSPYREQQRVAERGAKAIYIHSHMDEANFDTDRIRQCCVAVPDAQGHSTPTCSYNVLYRERDPRFAERAPQVQQTVQFFRGATFAKEGGLAS
jgi:7,8-dihydro-6-hydroxymethylpterin dimethyltransferase